MSAGRNIGFTSDFRDNLSGRQVTFISGTDVYPFSSDEMYRDVDGWIQNKQNVENIKIAYNNGFGSTTLDNNFDLYNEGLTGSIVNEFDLANLNVKLEGYNGGTYDGRYVYFSPYYNGTTFHGLVVRYDSTKDFNDNSSWEYYDLTKINPNYVGFSGAAFDGRYIYFCPLFLSTFFAYDEYTYGDTGKAHGNVLRYDTKKDFKDRNSWSCFDMTIANDAAKGYFGIIFTGKYLYFIPFYNGSGYHGLVAIYDITKNFSDGLSWSFLDLPNSVVAGSRGYIGGTYDGKYVYLAPFYDNDAGYHGLAVRLFVDNPNSSYSSVFDINTIINTTEIGAACFAGAVFDGRFIYFIPAYNSSDPHVIRYDTCQTIASTQASPQSDVFSYTNLWSDVGYLDYSNGAGSGFRGCAGGLFDGRYVWFIPGRLCDATSYGAGASNHLAIYDTKRSFITQESTDALFVGWNYLDKTLNWSRGAVYDGKYIYLVPHSVYGNNTQYSGLVYRIKTHISENNTSESIYKLAQSRELFIDSNQRTYVSILRSSNSNLAEEFWSDNDNMYISPLPVSSSIIFEDNTFSYHLRSRNSHLILSSSAGSYITVSGNLNVLGSVFGALTITGSNAFFVQNGLDVRGFLSSSVDKLMVARQGFYNDSGNLILSGGTTGIINFSSSLDFSDTNRSYHIRSRNSDLILSSSNSSIVSISGALNLIGGGTKNYSVVSRDTHLILSSSNGSVIAASSSLDLPNTDKSYHIRAVSSHLIFSSSAGSVVGISGVLDFVDGETKNYSIVSRNSHLILSSSIASQTTVSGNISALGTSDLQGNARIGNNTIYGRDAAAAGIEINNYGTGDRLSYIDFWSYVSASDYDCRIIRGSGQNGDVSIINKGTGAISLTTPDAGHIKFTTSNIERARIVSSGDVGFGIAAPSYKLHVDGPIALTGALINTSQHLILSSSAGSVIAASGVLAFVGGETKNYSIVSRNSHLILSSSEGSKVYVSGTLCLNTDSAAVIIGRKTTTNASSGVTPATQIHGVDGNTGTIMFRNSSTTTAPTIYFARSRGGTVDTDDVVQNGDVLGYLAFEGYSAAASKLLRGAAIYSKVDDEPDTTGDTTDMPGSLYFATTLNSEGSITERMVIKNDGKVGIGTISPSGSSILDISSTAGGLLFPRMSTTQRDALTAVNGMVVYNLTTDKLQVYAASTWVDLH